VRASVLRACVIIAAFMFPLVASGAETVKIRHATSLYADDKGAGMKYPDGVACNDKSVIVGDTGNDRLLRYAFQDNALKAGAEIKVPQLSQPVRIQFSSKGEILALDGKQRRIARLGADGAFKGYVTVEGAPGASGVVPRSFKIDRDDNLYVLDVFTGRVLVTNLDGKYQRHIDFPKEYGFFSDLAVDPKGTVLLIDSVSARVFSAQKGANAFSPLGASLEEYLNFPVSLTTDGRGTIYIADANGAAVGVMSQDGSFLGKQLTMGWTEGLLYYPSQVCINERGELFVADRGNSRVQVFTLVK
jgi:DNA-binding beta-propeller fold protein YncE